MLKRRPQSLTLDRYGGGIADGCLAICALTLIGILRSRTIQTLMLLLTLYALPIDLQVLEKLRLFTPTTGPSVETNALP